MAFSLPASSASPLPVPLPSDPASAFPIVPEEGATGPRAEAPSARKGELLQTSFVRSEEQDKRMVAYLKPRIDECRREMGLSLRIPRGGMFSASVSSLGLSSSAFSSGIGAQDGTWAAKRERHQKYYDGDMEWRKALYGQGSVFQDSNHTANLPSRFARLMAAQLDGDQLSTDPFCATMPQPTTLLRSGINANLAKAVERYLQIEIGKSNLREVLAEARLAALVKNDATVKPAWVRRTSSFKGTATVLVNAYVQEVPGPITGQTVAKQFPGPEIPLPDGSVIAPGAPFVLPTGEHIYENDDTVPDPDEQNPQRERLLKYPDFTMPNAGMRVFETIDNLRQTTVDFEGIEAATVFFKDHLFWPRCADLRQSDIQVHVYDDTLNSLKRKYGEFAQFAQYSEWSTSEASRARPEQGEQEFGSTRQCAGIHECYVLMDGDEDGEDEWYFVVFDYPNEKIVFADYLKNHMKEAPFVMIPGLEKVEGRPYGVGVYEKLKDVTLMVDLQLTLPEENYA